MLSVAILAGGLATRLRPTTEKIPKSLIEVAQKPFISHQLDYLRSQNVSHVVVCIGHLGEMIKDFVGDGSRWGINVEYSSDGSSLMGTGGAIKRALSLLGDSFFILYGDSYLPIDYSEIQDNFYKSNKKGLMTVLKNKNQWDKSNVVFSGGKIIEYNKVTSNSNMQYIDYGLGILKASAFDIYSENNKFDLSEIYHYLSINNQLVGHEVFQRFYEIGSFRGISDAQEYFLNSRKKDIQ